jgi:hypothetical protein
MKVSKLLNLIPKEDLEFLAVDTKVDFQVSKLTGISMFRLILFSMICGNRNSLRVMENFYHSAVFKSFAKTGNKTTRFSSIRDRIVTINAVFFEKIFLLLFEKFSHLLNEKKSITRFDSTMVAVSAVFVNWGMKVGSKTNKKQLKFTIGMKGSLPCHVSIFKTQDSLSEDKTIPKAIFQHKPKSEDIVVFDRGVQKRGTFVEFTEQSIQFVTRLKTDASYKIVSENKLQDKPKNATVTIIKDYIVHLKGDHKWIFVPMRLIIATIDETGEEIYFLTNIEKLAAYDIAFIYKQRWDIEVLFKFLKQELNLSHLVSRTENGIKVMIYMTLIVAILLIAYKKLNKLEGYKIPKLKFGNELEAQIIKDIVIRCGGNPAKMAYLFNDS